MSEVLLSRSRYSAQGRRSPGAMVAALALNGGVIALLLALPAAQVVIETVIPPTKVRFYDLPPVPPKYEPEQKVEPRPLQKPVIDKPLDITPVLPDIIVPTLDGGPDIMARNAGTGDGAGFVQPTIKPVEPARVPLVQAAKLDPRFADSFKPDYPAAMRRDEREGSVTLRVTIDEKGRVIAVEDVRSSDPAFFEAARRHALRSWRFIPAKRDGQPIQSQQTLTLRFELEA